MTVEMCRRCGGCGAISKNDQVITCPKCNGKGYTELQPVIDAEQVQERQRAPYRFRNMTIREVPIEEPENPKQKRIVEEIARIQREHGLVSR